MDNCNERCDALDELWAIVIWNENVRRDRLDRKEITLIDNLSVSYSEIDTVELIGIISL